MSLAKIWVYLPRRSWIGTLIYKVLIWGSILGRYPLLQAILKLKIFMYFEIYKDSHGDFRWRFVSSNGRIIADSAEGYSSRENAIHGINIIKLYSPVAPIHG